MTIMENVKRHYWSVMDAELYYFMEKNTEYLWNRMTEEERQDHIKRRNDNHQRVALLEEILSEHPKVKRQIM